jgi:transcription elongation factor GreA
MQRFKITKIGYDEIKAKLDNLIQVERPAVAKAIGSAIEMGDLSENEEYSSAKDKQKLVESMIATLNERLSNAEIIDLSGHSSDRIEFGAKVKLLDLNTEKEINYQLVSEFEADVNNGKLAIESLIGKSLIEKKVGDEIEIKTPGGIKEYKILEIKY